MTWMAPAGRSVYWLMQATADVPLDDEWLAPAEREALASLRSAKRRRDWRLGRWTVKQALARMGDITASALSGLADLVIATRPNGAPWPSLDGQSISWPVSLTHSHDRAVCAIAPAGALVGCDLERVEPRTDDFTREWFTPVEQQAIARAADAARSELVTLLWSAKESALKAIGAGLTMSTHSITVTVGSTFAGPHWNPLHVNCNGELEPMHGWWRKAGADLITIVMAPAPEPPLALGSFFEQD